MPFLVFILFTGNFNFASLKSWKLYYYLLFLLKISGLDLTTYDSYFTVSVEVFTNHIGWIEHLTMVLKPENKHQIIQWNHNFKNILFDDFQHQSFFIKQTFCKHHLLRSRKWKIAKTRQLTIQTFISYLIYSGVRRKFVKLWNAFSLTKFKYSMDV